MSRGIEIMGKFKKKGSYIVTKNIRGIEKERTKQRELET